jgi:hypothetical protein
LKEAAKLGFAGALTPPRRGSKAARDGAIKLREIAHLRDLLVLFDAAPRKGAATPKQLA